MNLRLTVPLFFIMFGLGSAVWGQRPLLDHPWEAPDFDWAFMQKNNIEAIQIRTYLVEGHQQPSFSKGEDLKLDSQGKVMTLTRMEGNLEDTVLKQILAYHSNGLPTWTETKDLRFHRTYRSGYRHTGADGIYQVKSYELLPNRDRLLLQARQYIYDGPDNSLLRAIHTLENRQVVEVHSFDYDAQKRVVAERIEDSRGEVTKTTHYEYDQDSRITRVEIAELGRATDFYIYTYNPMGQPMEIKWMSAGQVKGITRYEYDPEGRVAHLSRTLDPETSREKSLYSVYEYQPRAATDQPELTNEVANDDDLATSD